MADPHEEFLNSLGPGLKECEEPLPPVRLLPDQYFADRLGTLIGGGGSREVFEVFDNADAVIKKMKQTYPGANVIELIIWNAVRGGKWHEAFGEVSAISETGRYTESYPDWLSDLKSENVGKTKGGKFKVRDYAMIKLGDALNSARTHRYAWQGPEPKTIKG